MRDEWFYLKRWRDNKRPIWAVVDKNSGSVLEENLDRYAAEDLSSFLNNTAESSTYVVNLEMAKYNDNNKIKLQRGDK